MNKGPKLAPEKPKVAWECSGNDKQFLFLSCPADEILYGGAAGGGKSEALLMSACGTAENGIANNPNWKVLMLRRTFPELERSLIWRSQQLFTGLAKYDGQKHRWQFPQGGLLQFGHMKTAQNMVDYQSAEYSMIIFDELTHFTESMYTYLFSRLRSTDPSIRCKVKCATNPGGLGHGWVKRRFIDDKEPYKFYNKDISVNGKVERWSQVYIPATVFDNKYLIDNDPMYVRRLMELPEAEKKALLYGDWNVYSGQFFTEFTEEHIIEGFEIPFGWPVWISMDWGFATRCAIGFYTQDPDTDVFYMFDEIYVSKMNPYEVAPLIKAKLGKHFVNLVGRYADRRIMVKDEDTQVSTKQKFASQGIHFSLATDDRVQGWHSLRELLMKDRDGHLQFQVFKKCKEFIRVMPEQVFDMTHPEDMIRQAENHHCDQARYFAIMRKHKAVQALHSEPSMSYSSVTGYLSQETEETPLRLKIPRLTNAQKGVNYFFH